MNGLIISPKARNLRMAGFGKYAENAPPAPVATDSAGRMILSPELDLQVQAAGLDIRPLQESRDSTAFTVSNLDIRDLSGSRDAVEFAQSASVSDVQSSQIPILGTVFFLPKDVSPYRQNAYYVRNTSLSVGVTVTLEIGPQNADAFYVADSSAFSLLGGNTLLLVPSKLMRYARVRVSGLLSLANVTAYYFGRV